MTRTPTECARLATEMRLLRERSGLSLSVLADESAYSKSSWQRYLTGRALPPWLAVRALCILAKEPEPRLRALWELAESAWSRRGEVATAEPASVAELPRSGDSRAAEPAAGPAVSGPEAAGPDTALVLEPRPGRSVWWRARAAGAVAVALLAALLAFTGGPWTGSVAPSVPSTAAFHVGCTARACNGLDAGVEKCGVVPRTLLHKQTRFGFGLEIRYSAMCRAAWARVWNTRLGDVLSLTVPGQPKQSIAVARARDTTQFVLTALVAVPGRASRLTACLSAGSAGAPRCFSALSP